MNRRALLIFVFLCTAIMTRPALVLAALNTEVQKEVIELQQEMIGFNQKHIDLQEQEQKSAQVEYKQEEAPTQPQGPSFTVNEIVLEGNTIFTTGELRVYVKPFEGRVLSFNDLQKLANIITTYYQRAGYITSRAYLPPQKIYDGRVIIRIVEGRLGRFTITGNHWFSEQTYLDSLNFQHGQFLNLQQLAMAMADLNQLPDRSVKAFLEPGEIPGSSDLVIAAQDQEPIHASYEYNMNGTELTHISRHIFHMTDNNITGHGDTLQTSLSLAQQNEVLGADTQYVLPVPQDGLTYTVSTGNDFSRLGKDLRPLKVTADSVYFTPGVTKSFIKLPGLKVDGYVGFDFKNSKTLVDQNKLSEDRDRVVDVGPRVSIDDKYGKTMVSADLRGGIPDFLGSSGLHAPDTSRYKSGSEFGDVTVSVDRLNRLPWGTYLVLHGGGQYSPQPLNSLEQFYLGGMYSVRGYSENDSSGDSGVDFSAELRIPVYFIPSDWHVGKSKDKTWRDSLSFVTFVDGGRSFNYYRQSQGSALDRTLLSTGVGMRYYLTPDMNAQAGIGFPFGDTPSSGNKHDQIYLSARVGF